MRSQKWYRKNEKETMEKLGLQAVPGSGAFFIAKEDGESEYFLAQLKSTDANSYRISRVDMDKLEYHAQVSHKIPIFIVQFLEDGQCYLSIPLNKIDDLITYWSKEKSSPNSQSEPLGYIPNNETTFIPNKKIVKSGNREKYQKQREKEYEKFRKK